MNTEPPLKHVYDLFFIVHVSLLVLVHVAKRFRVQLFSTVSFRYIVNCVITASVRKLHLNSYV